MAITKVYLMNTLLEKDYAHTMYFSSEAAQRTWFQKRIQSAMTFTDFSYQRKDHIIRVPKHIDSLFAAKINYCMYQNTEYSNKWFYAFVTDMKYVDDGRTDVYIKTDCIQTWMFDITVKHSFVEREHAATDEPGDHTIDEGLELGEYVCNREYKDGTLGIYQYVMLVTEWYNSEESGDKPLSTPFGGIPYAGGAYIFNSSAEIAQIAHAFSTIGKEEAITAVYMIPKFILSNTSETAQYSGSGSPATYNYTVNKQVSLNGYIPRNKKLLTYPFSYILGSNNSGSSNVYKYEYFSDEDCIFKVSGVPVVGGSIKSCPVNYKGLPVNEEEGIMCGKFPTLSWSADLFTNWLTQNSVNIAMGIGAGALQIVGGVATMVGTAGVGTAIGGASVVGGVSTIANTLAQVHEKSFTPNSAKGNTNGGDINTANKTNTFYYYAMSIKAEIAKTLDGFFDMFGYKCNRVKIPEKNHRQSYWYTKTIDANIVGGIPQDDLQTIKDCYNRGITFWTNEEYYRNYSAPNAIL